MPFSGLGTLIEQLLYWRSFKARLFHGKKRVRAEGKRIVEALNYVEIDGELKAVSENASRVQRAKPRRPFLPKASVRPW